MELKVENARRLVIGGADGAEVTTVEVVDGANNRIGLLVINEGASSLWEDAILYAGADPTRMPQETLPKAVFRLGRAEVVLELEGAQPERQTQTTDTTTTHTETSSIPKPGDVVDPLPPINESPSSGPKEAGAPEGAQKGSGESQ
jgi:hypothetical protein